LVAFQTFTAVTPVRSIGAIACQLIILFYSSDQFFPVDGTKRNVNLK